MVVLLEGSPISTEELWSSVRLTIRFLVTSLTEALLPRLLRLASSRKSLGSSKLLPFKNDGGNCVLGDRQCCRSFLIPFPRSVPQHNPVSELYEKCFVLIFTVNCGTSYRQLCAFPNHVKSIELTTCGLQLICRNSSRMINGNRVHLSSI